MKVNSWLRNGWWLIIGLFVLSACGSPNTALTISGAWARPTPMIERAGAAYFVITGGSAEDRLIAAKSDVSAKTEIHETKNVDGTMQMSPVASLLIPANGAVELKPGSYHIMLIDLQKELKTGDKVTLTLTFEKAGEMTVVAEVKDE
jgi:hypothetical protein